MSAVDIDIHGRKAVGKTFGDKALGGQVIALVKREPADYVKNAGVAFKTRGMQDDPVAKMDNAGKPALGVLDSHPPHESVDLVALLKQHLGEITAVLSGDACY